MPARRRLADALRRTADRLALDPQTDDLRAAQARVAELDAVLDHERLYPAEWAYRRVRDTFGYEVLNGPFKGLRYPEDLALGIEAYSSKLLGIYEKELHPFVEELVAAAPATVVNIGASDGYYAIGFARRVPGARVVAFDTNEAHHPVLVAIAAANHVADRLEVRGTCTHETLDELARDALVVCDCESCELELLDPERVPALRSAWLLVECHDLIDDRITPTLTARFEATHSLRIVETTPRWIQDHPELSFLPVTTQQIAIQEFREGPMHWLLAEPRS